MEEVNGTFGVRHPPHSVGHFNLFLKVTAVSGSVNLNFANLKKEIRFQNADTDPSEGEEWMG